MKTSPNTNQYQFKERGLVAGTKALFVDRQEVSNSKYNPHAAGYVMGEGSGSFTQEIDHLRQGVSVLNQLQRSKIIYPTVDPLGGPAFQSMFDEQGRVDHEEKGQSVGNSGIEEKFIFGMTKTVDASGPFVDKPNMENIGATEGLFALADGKLSMGAFSGIEATQPIIQADKRYYVSNLFNGVIETTPRILGSFLPKIFSRSLDPLGNDTRAGIKVDLMSGNSHYNKGTSLVESMFDTKTKGSMPFTDRKGYMGSVTGFASGTMVSIPDTRHSKCEVLRYNDYLTPIPFDDTAYFSRVFSAGAAKNTASGLLSNFIGISSGSSDNLLPQGFKSARTGFIFTNDGLNVDSLAYGGMRRDA